MRDSLFFILLVAFAIGILSIPTVFAQYPGIGYTGIMALIDGSINIPGEIKFSSIGDSIMTLYHNATSSRNVKFPDKAGTVAFLDDITGGGNATSLNDLSDVVVSSPSYNHILQYDSSQWTNKLFTLNSQTCGGTQKISAINNQTGAITCTDDQEGPPASGNSTVLNDLGDVVLSSPQYLSTLFYNGIEWVNRIFTIDTKTCPGGQFVSAVNNQTGEVTCSTPSGSGNATTSNDLGDVVISSANYGNILINDGSQFVNRLFMINNQTVSNDFQIIGINNQTGAITTNQFSVNSLPVASDAFVNKIDNVTGEVTALTFSVNSLTCSNGDFIKKIDNVTGETVCFTPAVASGNATVLNDLGDVINSSPIYPSILGYNGSQYINKLFTANTITAIVGTALTGFDNQTGIHTTASFGNVTNLNDLGDVAMTNGNYLDILQYNGTQFTDKIFAAESKTCTGTDKYSAYNNQTGVFTCSTDAGGSGIPKPTQAAPKKWGQLIPMSATQSFNGLLESASLDGSEAYTFNATDNTGQLSQTFSVVGAGANSGINVNATNQNFYLGSANPYLIWKGYVSNTVANRMFIGFQSGQPTIPAGADTLLTSLSGFGICINSTSTTYQICGNDGSGAALNTGTGISENGATHTFEVYTTDAGVSWCAKVDGGAAVCETTAANLPAGSTRLYLNISLETTGVNAMTLGHEFVYVESDK